jgi:penicillin-binding protein 1C
MRWAVGIIVLVALPLAGWIATPLDPALLAPAREQSLTLTDRHGVTLRSTRAGDGGLSAWVPLDRIDPELLAAFVTVEDRRFYSHHGVDFRSAGRALWDNLRHGHTVSGASTLTMQLARLIAPSHRDWFGKAHQVVWALRLEAHLSKAEILEQYLNRVPLGQGTTGIAAGAALYFGAAPDRLSLAQASTLAGLAHAPSSDNPFVSPARALRRRAFVLARMGQEGHALPQDIARASAEPLMMVGSNRPFLAPHFTTWLLAADDTARSPHRGEWRTSIDLGLQTALEGEVRHTVDMLRDKGGRQAALVVLDNTTGEVLAWVGSPDFWADSAGQVDMVVSPRQPGSALKPFLYALAFDRGATPATVLADVATTYETASGPYHPRNYDRSFHGPVRAREALASSYNLPAVALADRIGFGTLLHGLQLAGFRSLDRGAEHYGLGLALGNGDVTLLALANGYRALANGGGWRPYRFDAVSATAPPPAEPPVRIASAVASAQVIDILADADARIPGFGLSSPFDFPFRVAAKTGTSRHFTDNWAVGVTQRFTIAVWVGDFSGRPMQGVSGVSGAGPLLHRAVLATAARYAPGDLVHPEGAGLVPVRICRVSGLRAGARCPAADEWFKPGSEPGDTCDWHREDGVHLPGEYAEWEHSTLPGSAFRVPRAAFNDVPPTAYRVPDVTLASGVAMGMSSTAGQNAERGTRNDQFRITSPQSGDRYRIPPGVGARYATVGLRSVGGGGAVRWRVDGKPVSGGRWSLVAGSHSITAESDSGERAEVRIEVE